MSPVAHNVKGHVLRQRSLEARSGLAPSCWLSPARPRARGHSPSSEQAPLSPLHIPLQGSEILRVTLLLSRNLPARHRPAFLPRPRWAASLGGPPGSARGPIRWPRGATRCNCSVGIGSAQGSSTGSTPGSGRRRQAGHSVLAQLLGPPVPCAQRCGSHGPHRTAVLESPREPDVQQEETPS